jgi:hypothetical protein
MQNVHALEFFMFKQWNFLISCADEQNKYLQKLIRFHVVNRNFISYYTIEIQYFTVLYLN